MIGTGEAIQGLHLLKQLANPASLASVNNNSVYASIWHSRFGHVNDTILKILSNKIPFSMPTSYSSSSCHICPISKF
uniref:GAG-pre-integrase domain-containing protein n=1 Tax=Cajanus cajan TaxID=3821 RepID=A0A151RI90_CAJCA|nr:hypothetical protein KK1_036337 [Cajanus cajan]